MLLGLACLLDLNKVVPSGLARSQIFVKVGRSKGVLIAPIKFNLEILKGSSEGYKSKFTRSKLNSMSVGYAHL